VGTGQEEQECLLPADPCILERREPDLLDRRVERLLSRMPLHGGYMTTGVPVTAISISTLAASCEFESCVGGATLVNFPT
jgi:hypothetical protein